MRYVTPTLIGLLLSPLALAAELRPGLWEFTTQAQSGGVALPDVQAMLAQMQNLPPQQREMMEQMLAKQGIAAGQKGVRMCISEATAKGGNIPLQDPDSGCSNEITERSEGLWKFRFKCPNGEGEGETRFQSDTAFSTTLNGNYNGKPGTLQSQASWVGGDCGGLPAR